MEKKWKMDRKSLCLLFVASLLITGLSAGAIWSVDNQVVLHTNENIAYSSEHGAYFAKASAVNEAGSSGNVILSLQNKVGGTWQTLEMKVISPGGTDTTSVWGRSERDTVYTVRMTLASSTYYSGQNPGRSAYGQLNYEAP